jgi:hypothetical protein
MMDHMTRDEPRQKTKYTFNNKIHFKCTDPFGFWEVSLDKGELPMGIKNHKFTTYRHAYEAIRLFYNNKGEQLSDFPFEKPVLDTKKPAKEK